MTSEAILLALFLSLATLICYFYLKKSSRSSKILFAVILLSAVSGWLGIMYVLSWYARVDFVGRVADTVGILAIVSLCVVALTLVTNYWPKRQCHKKKRGR